MNKYRLQYWNNTGNYKTEIVEWKCDGEKYKLELFGPTSPYYYIIATKL